MVQDKKDTFWDIERLLPQTKKKTSLSSSKKPSFAEVEVSGGHRQDSGESLSFAKASKDTPKVKSYDHLSPLICHVEIHPWKSSYHYYEFFCKNAMTYHKVAFDYQKFSGKPCERVPFFSYVPQYSQMDKKQLEWYFWWRENVRNGVFLDADLSYIYLYIYEIINLGDMIDTVRSCASLIDVWVHYREVYPQLNRALGEWICDYSLLNQVPIRYPWPGITADMIKDCSLGEVFLGFDMEDHESIVRYLLSFCSGYQYRKSKFYSEHSELYDDVIPHCLLRVVPFLGLWEGENTVPKKHISRSAFVGALCSYRIRKHIEVDYIPLCGAEQKALVTSVIKYSENLLRACLGIRSRLGTSELPSNIMSAINGYFEERFSHQGGSMEIRPTYEKLYDGPCEEFSMEKALQIERTSWEVTEELVEAFEENVSNDTLLGDSALNEPQVKVSLPSEICEIEATPQSDSENAVSEFLTQIDTYRAFFDAIVSRDIGMQRAFCKQKGMFAEHVIDVINEKAADI